MRVLCIENPTVINFESTVHKGEIYTVFRTYTSEEIYNASGITTVFPLFYELEESRDYIYAAHLFVEISDLDINELIKIEEHEPAEVI